MQFGGTGTQHHPPSHPPCLDCAVCAAWGPDGTKFPPFLTQTWDLLSAIAFFFVLIFKRGHCGFKELPRLAFVTGGEGGVVAEVGTQKNEIKRSTTKRS